MRDVKPGDVLVVYDSTFPAWLIRLGATMMRKPNKWNHVLIMSHKDANGTWWAIEAHPGKVSWTAGKDLHRYLTSSKTIDNAEQPKTISQRAQVVNVAKLMFGAEYDIEGIGLDALEAIGLWPRSFRVTSKKYNPPTEVVCSSLVRYAYEKVGLACPSTESLRRTTPADWAQFILTKAWNGKNTFLEESY
jgi:hypothetical protein